jgi:cell division protein FtsB
VFRSESLALREVTAQLAATRAALQKAGAQLDTVAAQRKEIERLTREAHELHSSEMAEEVARRDAVTAQRDTACAIQVELEQRIAALEAENAALQTEVGRLAMWADAAIRLRDVGLTQGAWARFLADTAEAEPNAALTPEMVAPLVADALRKEGK